MTTNTETTEARTTGALALRTGQDQWTAAEADRAEVARLREELQARTAARAAATAAAEALGRALQDPNLDDANRAAVLDQVQRLGAGLR